MGLLDLIPKNSLAGKILTHRNLFLLGISMILCGLPWSHAIMSIGQFVLVGNWLLEADFKEKFKKLCSNKLVCLIIAFFLLHLIGLLWSSDIGYAFKDIRIKLVLFVIPFILGSSRPMGKHQFKFLLHLFILSVFVVSLFSFAKYFGWYGETINDKRELAIRISHIRYGLMIAFASFCCVFYGNKFTGSRILYFMGALYFFLTLLVFQFYSGLMAFFIVFCFLMLRNLFDIELSIFKKLFSVLALLIFISVPSYLFFQVYQEFHHVPEKLNYDQENLDEKTESGNKYTHYLDIPYRENGYYTWRFINYKELRKEWNERSKLNFDSMDRRGQQLHNTLIRYLTSMGLKKDSVGISRLSDKDINAIENGVANIYFTQNNKLKGRIHSTLYEIENYRKYHIAEGFSVAMRLEYWKVAFDIIEDNPFFGVGTGDIQNEFNNIYESDQSVLNNKDYWRRSHNQYLSTWVQLGIPGLLLLLVVLFFPLFQRGNHKNFLFMVFIALISLSMLTEDTLETQAGATLFTIFYSLFLLNPKP